MMRGRIGLLVVSGALLGGAALLLASPSLRQALVPAALLGGAGPAASPDRAGVTDTATPADAALLDTAFGLSAPEGIAASAGNRPIFAEQVISGYEPSDVGAIPAEITTIRPLFGCQLTRPMPGTLVGHVTAGQSGMPTGLTTYGEVHLAAAVEAFVDAYRATEPGMQITLTGPHYEAYDVAVTETSAPVYLVLETGAGNRIWNIHAAEGVRIERVVLLGGDQAGVANLDPVVPVEVILGNGLAECGIQPAYPPSRGQMADASDAPGAQPMAQARIDEALALSEAYDIWFRDVFDLRAGESRVGFDRGTISVIGPVPTGEAPLATWASIDGADVRATHDRYLDIAGQTAPGEDFAGRVLGIVTGFALGDLERLRLGGAF